MYTFISIVIVVVAILLILSVLVQNSKDGGLAANFAGANQVAGVRQTADFIEKFTWWLAVAIVALSLLANVFVQKNQKSVSTEVEKKIVNQPTGAVPGFQTTGALKQQPAAAEQKPAAQEPAKEQPAKK